MPRRRNGNGPVLHTDGTRMVITLDGGRARDKEGKDIYQNSPLRDEKLRFSVNRNGRFLFHKKMETSPKFEAQQKLDDEGKPIPSQRREQEIQKWGYSNRPEFVMENVLLDEPDVAFRYEVDRDWWSRHGVTRVRF